MPLSKAELVSKILNFVMDDPDIQEFAGAHAGRLIHDWKEVITIKGLEDTPQYDYVYALLTEAKSHLLTCALSQMVNISVEFGVERAEEQQ